MNVRRGHPSFTSTKENRRSATTSGQAMVETVIVLLFLMFAFLAVFQYVDNLRAKLSLEYAALRCARARTVGYNDYKLLKTARLATMATAGECLTKTDRGTVPSTGELQGRMNTYIASRNDAEARCILDFDYWDPGTTLNPQTTTSGNELTVRIHQRRPQLFNPLAFSSRVGDAVPDEGNRPRRDLVGEHSMEAHYPAYLQ